MPTSVQRRTFVIACGAAVAGCFVGVLCFLWRRRQDRSEAHEEHTSSSSQTIDASATHDTTQKWSNNASISVPTVVVPNLGFRFADAEFALQWRLVRSGVWYDYSEEDFAQMTPSAVAEYQLVQSELLTAETGTSPHEGPQINVVAEDLFVQSMSALEYVERSRQGLPTVELDPSIAEELTFNLREVVSIVNDARMWDPTQPTPDDENDDEGQPVSNTPRSTACDDDDDEDEFEEGTAAVEALPPPRQHFTPLVDACMCAFTELGENSVHENIVRSVINIVAVRGGIVIVVQLVCSDSDDVRRSLMPLFIRIFRSTIVQMGCDGHLIAQQDRANFLQFALPSARQDYPGVMMTLPARRLQMLPTSHPTAQLLLDRVNNGNGRSGHGINIHAAQGRPSHNHQRNHVSNRGGAGVTSPSAATGGGNRLGNVIACMERRAGEHDTNATNGTVEIYLMQLPSRSMFDRVHQDMPLQPLDMGRPTGIYFRPDLLTFVVVVAGSRAAARKIVKRIGESLKPYNSHKRCLAYLHGPSQLSYVLQWPTDSSTFLTHYFGPFDFQYFPNRASPERSSIRVAIRDIGPHESFAMLQRAVTQAYDERWMLRRPSVEGWSRLEISLESPEGKPLTEYVTMLEHEGRFIHISWTTPRGQGVIHSDDVRRCLMFHPL